MLMNGKEVKNLIISGEKFIKSNDDLIGKNMKIDNYGYGNGNSIVIKFDDGSTDYPYDSYAQTQTIAIDAYRLGSDQDPMYSGLWLGGKIKTYKNSNQSKSAWVKASDVTIV